MKKLILLAALLWAGSAQAQIGGGVTSTGAITPGNCVSWASVNVIQDAGSACGGGGGSVSVTAGSSNIVITPSPGTGTFTVDTSTTPTFLGVTTTTLTGFNASLSGTTTLSSAQILAGNINNTAIGATTSSTALFSTITSGSAQITGGAINGTAIGATTSSTGVFTTVTAGTFNATGSGQYQINGTNAIRYPDGGLDVTSIAAGHLATPAYLTTSGFNVAVGYNALNASTTSTNSVAVGANALSKETVVGSEVAVGSGALQNAIQTITTSGNVAVGFQALNTLTTGIGGNVSIGYQAMASVTTATQNVAIGWSALKITATANTAIGYNVSPNMTGNNNVALGALTLGGRGTNVISGSGNTAIGASAMGATTGTLSGSNNMALGNSTFLVITSGSQNTGIGDHVGAFTLTTGSNNTMLGAYAGDNVLTTGSNNILISIGASAQAQAGMDTALSTTSSSLGIGSGRVGNGDTSVGIGALNGTTTNNNGSVAVGYNALNGVTAGVGNTALGFAAGKLVTTGTTNTILGSNVGSTVLTIGSSNILIGVNSAIGTTTSSDSNLIRIGGTGGPLIDSSLTNTSTGQSTAFHGLLALSDITSDATHTDAAVCEDTTTHALYAGSGTLGVCLGTSSARFKTDVKPLLEGVEEINDLKPISFYYKKGHGDNGAKLQYGFLAEDMIKIIPKLVDLDKEGKPNSVDMLGLVPILVRVAQEQQKEINDLKEQLRSR